KEPFYIGTPLYGQVRIGSFDPRAFTVVIDNGTRPRIYFDVNNNGDLTDDGDGSANELSVPDSRLFRSVVFTPTVHLNASSESQDYRLAFDFWPKGPDDVPMLVANSSALYVGQARLANKSVSIGILSQTLAPITFGETILKDRMKFGIDLNGN